MDVAAWLNRLGLPQYVEPFRANEIHTEVLKNSRQTISERSELVRSDTGAKY